MDKGSVRNQARLSRPGYIRQPLEIPQRGKFVGGNIHKLAAGYGLISHPKQIAEEAASFNGRAETSPQCFALCLGLVPSAPPFS